MNLHSFDEYVDLLYGKIGTPERDAIEAQLQKEAKHYFANKNCIASTNKNESYGKTHCVVQTEK